MTDNNGTVDVFITITFVAELPILIVGERSLSLRCRFNRIPICAVGKWRPEGKRPVRRMNVGKPMGDWKQPIGWPRATPANLAEEGAKA